MKDKNDVEIYEGDILELDDDYIAVVEWISKYASFYIRYIENESTNNRMETIGDECFGQYVKVIGNIHDNPELLKSTNKENKTC